MKVLSVVSSGRSAQFISVHVFPLLVTGKRFGSLRSVFRGTIGMSARAHSPSKPGPIAGCGYFTTVEQKKRSSTPFHPLLSAIRSDHRLENCFAESKTLPERVPQKPFTITSRKALRLPRKLATGITENLLRALMVTCRGEWSTTLLVPPKHIAGTPSTLRVGNPYWLSK